jgi:hypothetical protein
MEDYRVVGFIGPHTVQTIGPQMAARVSASCTGRLYSQKQFLFLFLVLICQRLTKRQGLVRLEGLVISIKYNYLIGTRTRDLGL